MTALPLLLSLMIGSPGAALIERFECQRCHDGLEARPVPVERHCVHCHQAIEADRMEAPDKIKEEWKKNIKSMRFAPSLEGIGQQLRPEWIASYLVEPHDLRPNLGGMMPRLTITDQEAKTIARHLAGPPKSSATVDPQLIEQGQERFAALGCRSCHAFSGVDPTWAPLDREAWKSASPAVLLAPDLASTRARMRTEVIRDFIRAPRKVRRSALMPDFDLDDRTAEALTAFIVAAPLAPVPVAVLPARLPVLERPVAFAEVKTKVFHKACRHCHADPAKTHGDGGPGNTGGIGYRGRGLSLSDHRSIQAGSLDDHGARRSIFKPLGDGTPKLIAHLLARQVEERGGKVDGVLGMPLGLPALTPEEVQLVESWIAQGRPP
jgi:hypothetical protein